MDHAPWVAGRSSVHCPSAYCHSHVCPGRREVAAEVGAALGAAADVVVVAAAGTDWASEIEHLGLHRMGTSTGSAVGGSRLADVAAAGGEDTALTYLDSRCCMDSVVRWPSPPRPSLDLLEVRVRESTTDRIAATACRRRSSWP